MPAAMSLSPMGEYARRHESDRFLAAQLAPPELRDDFYTLIAFHHELGAIASKVKEPMMGTIRLQWWREAIMAIGQGQAAPAHEVLTPLADLVRRRQLPVADLLGMIDSHERDFADEPWQSAQDLAIQAQAQALPLLQLQFRLAGLDVTPSADVAALMGVVDIICQRRMAPLTAPDMAGLHAQLVGRLKYQTGNRLQRRLQVGGKLADYALRQLKTAGFDADHPRARMPHPLRGPMLVWGAAFW